MDRSNHSKKSASFDVQYLENCLLDHEAIHCLIYEKNISTAKETSKEILFTQQKTTVNVPCFIKLNSKLIYLFANIITVVAFCPN